MSNAIKAFAFGLFVFAAGLVSAPANAVPISTPVALTVGNSLIVDDYKYTLTGCSTSSCTNGTFTAFGTGIKITGASGPFATQSAGASAVDTTLTFTVETLDGAYLNGVNLGIDGTATYSAVDTNIGAGLKDFTSGLSVYTGADPKVNGTGSGTLATVAKPFSSNSNKAILKLDIATHATVPNSATTNYATAGVTRVPEPMSILLLTSGVVAVMSVRRRRRS